MSHPFLTRSPTALRAKVVYLLFGIALTLFHSSVLNAQEPVEWGKPSNGLRLSMSIDYTTQELIFSIQNVSEHIQVIGLGEGINFVPVRLTVTVTTTDGRLRESELGMRSGMGATGAGMYAIECHC